MLIFVWYVVLSKDYLGKLINNYFQNYHSDDNFNQVQNKATDVAPNFELDCTFPPIQNNLPNVYFLASEISINIKF